MIHIALREISSPLDEDTKQPIEGIIKFTDNRAGMITYDDIWNYFSAETNLRWNWTHSIAEVIGGETWLDSGILKKKKPEIFIWPSSSISSQYCTPWEGTGGEN